ncbi:hypothetical protein ACJJIW_00170 [Microbulbifer sp. JMSA004]|uniref:hypothetical protein n=1 Tax=Microbulbifer sp. JMSA004 TaxID=3243370 RepID=UPI004039FD26
MKNIAQFLLLLLVAAMTWILLQPFPGDEIKILEITKGTVGTFVIGATKSETLSNNIKSSFAPMLNSKECPKNWIKVNEMSRIQRECLMDSSGWGDPTHQQRTHH